ncbi:MAG: BspA family leucine-rich repeat surface protein, partial [Bacteroidales bacterium]|nr:BspA family leucine-rich repeat surface protein [Bacteroidales bacterium]
MASMFSGCSTLSSLDVSNWNTGKVTSMANMFQNCNALTTLNVSNFNTENVTNLSSMFNGCKVLTTLNVSNWDTGKATTMGQMFQYCNGLTNLDVSNWNTANVTNMNNMFNGCIGLDSLDVSNWDTGKVTNMSNMFLTCGRLKSLDFSNWNTAKVTSKTNMLSACNALKKIKTNFNIIAGMTLPYNGPTGYVNGWYNAETAAICSKSGNNAVITLSDPDVAETWVRGKTIDNLLWTSNEDDSNWRNYGNWATVKNGDTITIDALPVHTSPIPVTIPATANQPEYGSDMGSVRLMNGDTLILEYGALMDTKNLGVTLGALRTSLVVRGEDRGEWILAGPNVKMKDGEGTREQLSGDYYLNKLPWVYMHEISIEQGENPTISWQNAFPQLTEVLTPESAFAIRVDNKYGKYGINSERYYSKDSVKKHLGEQDVTFTFEGVPY